MATVKDEIDELGKKITAEARKNALPNKNTGALDRSFSYEYAFLNDEKFNIVIFEKYYGKYLNDKTHYMDKAVAKYLNRGVEEITNVMADEFMNEIKNKL